MCRPFTEFGRIIERRVAPLKAGGIKTSREYRVMNPRELFPRNLLSGSAQTRPIILINFALTDLDPLSRAIEREKEKKERERMQRRVR